MVLDFKKPFFLSANQRLNYYIKFYIPGILSILCTVLAFMCLTILYNRFSAPLRYFSVSRRPRMQHFTIIKHFVSGAQGGAGLLQPILQSNVHQRLQRMPRLRGHPARCVPWGGGKTDRLRLHLPHHSGREVCVACSFGGYEVNTLKR